MIGEGGATQADRIVGLFAWTFPSVCLLSVCNVMFNDSVLFAVRVVGNRLPTLVQRLARTASAMFNLSVAVLGYMWIHGSCRPAVEVCSSNVLADLNCSKPVSLTLCSAFAFSIWDRFATVLLYPEHSSSFSERMGESGAVVIAWQLVGEREGLAPLFVALLIARRARFAFPRISRWVCGVLRTAVAFVAVNALGHNCNTVSEKASVGVLLSTLLLGNRLPYESAPAKAPPCREPRLGKWTASKRGPSGRALLKATLNPPTSSALPDTQKPKEK